MASDVTEYLNTDMNAKSKMKGTNQCGLKDSVKLCLNLKKYLKENKKFFFSSHNLNYFCTSLSCLTAKKTLLIHNAGYDK